MSPVIKNGVHEIEKKGAYKIDMRYVRDKGGVKYVYPDSLPLQVRRFVVHPIEDLEAATGLPVKAHLHAKVLEQVTPGKLIPGANWDPVYEPPPPDVPPPPVAWDAPKTARVIFLAAVDSLGKALDGDIIRHVNTHVQVGDMEDEVVKAMEWLIMIHARLIDGA